jgi:hypothetical protein
MSKRNKNKIKVNRSKEKNLSIDAEKAFNKNPTLFHDKTLKELGLEGMFLNTIKAAYDKLRANIILSGEQLKPFPLMSGTR